MKLDTQAKRDCWNLYQQIVPNFIRTYKNRKHEAIQRLDPEVGDRTVKKILSEATDDAIEEHPFPVQLAIIDLMAPDRSPRLYNRLASSIGQTVEEHARLKSLKSLHRLKYYRFLPSTRDRDDFRIVGGNIDIKANKFSTTFVHHPRGKGAKHTKNKGFVFLKNNRLHMLGWRESAMRLATITLPEESLDTNSSEIHGGVASIGLETLGPYLSRCIIFCKGHKYYDNPPTEEFLKEKLRYSSGSEFGFMLC